jgi:hypothetical protein
MEPVGPVVVDITRDDRAGVTLPTAIQPVGGDQLEPGRAGQVEGAKPRTTEEKLADLELRVVMACGAAGAAVVEAERSKS